MSRTLDEREAFRACREFLSQYNQREKSEALDQLIRWMGEGSWEHDALETADPAQWHDWVRSVDQVVGQRQDIIRAELHELLSSALAPESLDEFSPSLDDYFGILIDVVAGPAGGQGGDLFYFTACSPAWLAEASSHTPKGFGWERARLVIPEWDLGVIRRAVEDLCRHTTGSSWTDVAVKLSRHMRWEFEDYDG